VADVTYDVVVCVYKNTDSLQNYIIQDLKEKLPIDIELLIELYRSEEGFTIRVLGVTIRNLLNLGLCVRTMPASCRLLVDELTHGTIYR